MRKKPTRKFVLGKLVVALSGVTYGVTELPIYR